MLRTKQNTSASPTSDYGYPPSYRPGLITYNRLIDSAGKLALVREGVNPFSKDAYHAFLDLTWWKLAILSFVFYVVVVVTFGVLYLCFGGVYKTSDGVEVEATFLECMWFSIQTEDAIGYGVLHPVTRTCNMLVCAQSYCALLISSIQSGVVFAKISRPSKLKHNFLHSNVALITDEVPSFYADESENPDSGIGEYRKGRKCLVFRFVNARISVLCEPKFTLLCACQDKENSVELTVHELAFELNRQVGRVRSMDLSKPYLGLPWTVVHPIDEHSPLYGRSADELADMRMEIIPVVDGIDEVVSDNVQVKWSYMASDMVWDATFVPMVFTGLPDGDIHESVSYETTPLLPQTDKSTSVPAAEQKFVVDINLISHYKLKHQERRNSSNSYRRRFSHRILS
eukprot:CFRG5767T1